MMKAFAEVVVLSLAMSTIAQQVTTPAVPNVAPAQPQPGIATGATGGMGTPAFGRDALGGVNSAPTVPGRPTFGPPPVLMTPDQLLPPYPYPLVLAPELFPLEPYLELPRQPAIAQGRPGGLGVTITGGSASPPPITTTPSTNAMTTATNVVPVVTNAAPTNPPSGVITNP